MSKSKKKIKKEKAQSQKIQKLNDWNIHLAGAKDKQFYSIRRIDILLITISGACVYIVFEFLKFMNTTKSIIDFQFNINLLKACAISSVAAIAINFISQIFGYHANKVEVQYSREIINQLEDHVSDKCKLNILDKKSIIFNRLTDVSNIISAILMGIGIVVLVIYNLLTF